jgi:hypothetical protein
LLLAVALLGCLDRDAAQAAGIRDLDDGWLVPASEARALLSRQLAPTPDGTPLARPPEPDGVWVELAQGRLYGIRELPSLALAGGCSRRRLRVDGRWQRLGSTLWREDAVWLRIAIGQARRWAVRAGQAAAAWPGGLSERCLDLAAEVEQPLPAGLRLNARWHLLDRPPWQAERGWRRVALLTGGRPPARWALACDRDGRGRPAMQAELLLSQGGVGCGIRAAPATGTLGISTWWVAGNVMLRSSHLDHPELGITHRWSLVFGGGGGAP